jgi:two-component system response regulator NreC
VARQVSVERAINREPHHRGLYSSTTHELLAVPSPSPSPTVYSSLPFCRVLIADDHPIVRTAFRCLLETAPRITVVAEAQDGEEALAKIVELRPDVALVDIAMPKMNGIDVARRSAAARAPTRILTLTAAEDERAVRESLAAGAAGFVPKSAAAVELIAAIHAVATGGRYLHPRSMPALIRTLPAGRCQGELSAREGEVLRLVALGSSNKEIASQLSLSIKTVETYKARAMEKIGASSRVDIMRFAVRRGWLGNREVS